MFDFIEEWQKRRRLTKLDRLVNIVKKNLASGKSMIVFGTEGEMIGTISFTKDGKVDNDNLNSFITTIHSGATDMIELEMTTDPSYALQYVVGSFCERVQYNKMLTDVPITEIPGVT